MGCSGSITANKWSLASICEPTGNVKESVCHPSPRTVVTHVRSTQKPKWGRSGLLCLLTTSYYFGNIKKTALAFCRSGLFQIGYERLAPRRVRLAVASVERDVRLSQRVERQGRARVSRIVETILRPAGG